MFVRRVGTPEVIRVAENDPRRCPSWPGVIAFDRAVGADGHEHRGFDGAVRGLERLAACGTGAACKRESDRPIVAAQPSRPAPRAFPVES